MKIVVLPLDERPCNYNYLQALPLPSEVNLVLPSKSYLSNKKEICDLDRLAKWLIDETMDADYLVLSFDTLLYGGIVPSRNHHFSLDGIFKRSNVISKIKELNPKIKIFANELIMRCPSYNSSDEEPDYFETNGYNIFHLGQLIDKKQLNEITLNEEKELKSLKEKLDKNILDDFLNRRKKNLEGILNNLRYVKDGLIDFFVIPQDDCSEYGFTSMDTRKIKEFIEENNLTENIVMYPGADEIGLTLVSRVLNDYFKYEPKIFVFFGSNLGRNAIPMFEDRPVNETIKYHIYAIKGIYVSSISEADICLGINNGSEFIDIKDKRVSIVYEKNRNLYSFIDTIKYIINLKKNVGIADIAFCNEGDKELIKHLDNKNLLFKISAYAGWNTSSNTIGTTLANLISYFYSKDDIKKDKSLLNRYIEDYIYMGVVRNLIIFEINKNNDKGITKFNLGSKRKYYEELGKKLILNETKKFSNTLFSYIKDLKISFIWNRTFEIELNIEDSL